MKRTIPIALALLLPLLTVAQYDDIHGISPARLAEVQAQKVAFITQRLQLTPEESQVFWPIYNAYEKEIRTVRKQIGGNRRDRPAYANLTDEQAAPLLAKEIEGRRQQTVIWEKYMLRFRDAVGARKALYLDRVERDFTRQLLKRTMDRPSPRSRRQGEGG